MKVVAHTTSLDVTIDWENNSMGGERKKTLLDGVGSTMACYF
jgi:hypothetical protein